MAQHSSNGSNGTTATVPPTSTAAGRTTSAAIFAGPYAPAPDIQAQRSMLAARARTLGRGDVDASEIMAAVGFQKWGQRVAARGVDGK